MASITISTVAKEAYITSEVTGSEKLLAINKGGKPTTIAVNQILDKIDDEIVDRIDDQLIEKIEEQLDDIIDDRLDDIDPNKSFNWNEVL